MVAKVVIVQSMSLKQQALGLFGALHWSVGPPVLAQQLPRSRPNRFGSHRDQLTGRMQSVSLLRRRKSKLVQ